MDSNTHSTSAPAGLAALVAVVEELVDQGPRTGWPTPPWPNRSWSCGGCWTASKATGSRAWPPWTPAAPPAPNTASRPAPPLPGSGTGCAWAPATAASLVRTARALYRGPLTGTAQALAEGTISPAHAQVLAAGTHDLPDHLAAEAEPVLLEAARRLDPPRLRRAIAHLRLVADPDTADDQAERQHQQRGLWLASTWEGMVAVNGLLDPEAGQTLLAALEPLARPTSADDDRSGGQRRADALAELARRTLEAGQLPQTGGVRPQLTVTVDLDSLLGHLAGWAGRPAGPGRWTRRRAGGWPVTARSPGCWSPATPPTTTQAPTTGWRPGCGRRRPGSPRPLGVPRPSRWRSAAPAGSYSPPNAPPWWSATAAARWPAATGPRPGARPTICSTGSMAAPPTWPTWPWCAGPTTGRSTRAAGELARDPDGRLTATPPHRRPQRAPAAA